MKQIILKKGQISLEEVPTPICSENNVLVQNYYSLISAGTENTTINFSKANIIKKALNYPDKIAKGVQILKRKGVTETFKLTKNFLEFPSALGYSCAGKVIAIGDNIKDIKRGDMVAGSGAQYANHAEIVSIPRNLLVKIPEELNIKTACSASVGAIALHGVRQLEPQLGETIVVIGLGLIGNLAAQILKANGNKVIGIDINNLRLKKAEELGIDFVFNSTNTNLTQKILKITNNIGADGVIIAASVNNSTLINESLDFTRKRGRVVVLGVVGLNIQRNRWYEKEIDLKISCSLGPGRYDNNYENKCIDYPLPYVRWTENRNMEAYLDLLKSKKVNFETLIEKEFPLEQCKEAYAALNTQPQPLAIIFKYNQIEVIPTNDSHILTISPLQNNNINNKIHVALIGVGNFMISTHIPNLLKLKNIYEIKGVCVDNSVKANEWAKKLNASYACTDYKELINKTDIDLFIVATRHNTHYQIATDLLNNNKNILLEKPLCLNETDLQNFIHNIYNKTKIPMFTIGFNRRYSPITIVIQKHLQNRNGPIMINYRINDEHLPNNHWVNTEEGGGRILGNAVHMFDLINFFIHKNVIKISAHSIESSYYLANDNFDAQIKYEDGSIANIFYTTLGNNKLPKEYIEIFADGKIYIINNFQTLKVFNSTGNISYFKPNQGHLDELKIIAQSLKNNTLPIPIEDIIQATKISFEIQKQVNNKY